MSSEQTLSEREEYEAMSDVEFEDAAAGTTPRVASNNSSAGNHNDTPAVSAALPTLAPSSAPKPAEHHATPSGNTPIADTLISCPIAGCKESFPSMLETQTHAENAHNRYICIFQECPRSWVPYQSLRSRRRHMHQTLLPKQPHDDRPQQERLRPAATGDDSSLSCKDCTATLPDKAAMQAHLRDAHNLYLCTVPACERKDHPFRKYSYERHMLGIHHIDVKKSAQPAAHRHLPATSSQGAASAPPHACPILNCKATCPDLSALETHLNDEHRMYLCTVPGCPKNNQPFSWWDQYDRHMAAAHQTDVAGASWRQKDNEARRGIAPLVGVEYDDDMRRQPEGAEGGEGGSAPYDVEAAVPGKRKWQDDEVPCEGGLSGINSFLGTVKKMKEEHDAGLAFRPADTPPAEGGIASFLQETTRMREQYGAGLAVASATTPAIMPSPASAAITYRALPAGPVATQAQMQVAIRPAWPAATTPTAKPAAVLPPWTPAFSSAAMQQAIASYTSPYPLVPNSSPSRAHTSTPAVGPLGPAPPDYFPNHTANTIPHLQRKKARLTTLVTDLSSQLIHERARHEASLVAANEKRFKEKDAMVRHQEELEAVAAMASNGGRIRRQHEYMDELRQGWRDMFDEEVREERRRHELAEREIWGLLRRGG